jgi:hypothetical protein
MGANQEIATTGLDLFKGSKIQLSSLKSVRAFKVNLEALRKCLGIYKNAGHYHNIQAKS